MFLGEEAEELFETNWELEVDKFDDMGSMEKVLRDIYAISFKEPYLASRRRSRLTLFRQESLMNAFLIL